MNRRNIYLVIGALVVIIAILGYVVYEEQHKGAKLEINVDDSSVTVETN